MPAQARRPGPHVGRLAAREAEGPDEAAAVVAEEVRPGEVRHAAAAVDDPARDRAALGVRVLVDRQARARCDRSRSRG